MVSNAFIGDASAVIVTSMRFENASEGDEEGVRVELRCLEPQAHQGSSSAAQPIVLGPAVWRVDIFSAVAASPGNLERAHYHSRFTGLEPGEREWDEKLTTHPILWLSRHLQSTVVSHAGEMVDAENQTLDEELVAAREAILYEVRHRLHKFGVSEQRLAVSE